MDFSAAFSGISVNDLAAAKQFYGKTLGISPIREEMGAIGLDLKGQKIFIYPKEDHQPASYTVLNFKVDDINSAVDQLVAKGVSFERYDNMPGQQDERGVMRGKEANMGPNIAWFKDPAGNVLSLVEE